MNIPRLLSALAVFAFLLVVEPLAGQVVNDGATATLSNVTTNITGTVTVGTNGAFTRLVLSDNALLTNSGHGVISRNLAARSNEVQLISPTARWRMGGTFYVGSNGANASLIVSNGAFVDDGSASFGFRLESSNNFALVSGPGSLWSNRFGLDLGGLGRGNHMIVSNGGLVISRTARLGVDASAGNNLAMVSGSGSVWSNATSLSVGNIAPGNRLVIEAGGLVSSDTGIIGDFGSASNNEALVTGPGSLWRNNGLVIGSQMGFNRLVVSNGAAVLSGGGGSLGASSNNKLVVTGNGSIWSNATTLFLMNRADVTDGGWLACTDGYLATSNSMVVLSGPSGWNNLGALQVGYTANGSTLIASNGATVLSSNAFIGAGTSLGNNNLALLTGAGTLWSNRSDFTLGDFSVGNRLVVSNSATITTSNLFVGLQSSSGSNRVVVDGGTLRAGVLDVRRGTNRFQAGLIDTDRLVLTNTAGKFEFLGGTLVTRGALINNGVSFEVGMAGANPTTWDLRAGGSSHFVGLDVLVGNTSSFNQLLITDGALLTNVSGGFIGLGTSGNSNVVTIANAGSQWRTPSDFFLGLSGSANRLMVSNAGWLADADGYLGYSVGATNSARVTGAGSTWSNAINLVVGEVGAGNQLQVDGGGLVVSGGGSVGRTATASGNTATVTGSGSQWLVTSDLAVGSSGSGNRLIVENGGRVDDFIGNLATTAASSNNFAQVSGSGSLWSNRANVIVGWFGSGNQLLVSNGGKVINVEGGTIGSQVSAPGNVVTVTGSGSVWSSGTGLSVGNLGASNRLVVEAGGRVDCDRGVVAYGTGSNNVALVTGAGSVWSNVSLQVGGFGPNNQLIVSNGGKVTVAGVGTIGAESGAANNTITVTEPGAALKVGRYLIVGSNGPSSSLVVSNGGFVSDDFGYLGYSPGSSNNLAVVTGTGSLWSNQAIVVIESQGNRLVVSDGGTVLTSAYGLLDGSNNLALVTGPGSLWNSFASLQVGIGGSANNLVVSNGARVFDASGLVGNGGSGNQVTVTGAGSLWSNRLDLSVGKAGSAHRLVVTSGGTVTASNILVGETVSSADNRVIVAGGTLRAANAAGTGVLDVRRGTNVLNSGLVDVDQLVVTNKGTVPIPNVFGNSSSNHIPGNGITGPASVYPSTITVAGLGGSVTKVSVTLSNLTYEVPRYLDILLVSPGGQKVMLMSDAGSGFSVSHVRLTFDDTATTLLPPENIAPITSGTYHPTDYEPGDTMPSPAPAGPYSTSLSSLNGINPNGDWSLYITRDAVGAPASTDSLVGWGLRIEIEDSFFDPAVFEFNGGTLITRGASINNGHPLIMGGPGGAPAIWNARSGVIDNVVTSDLIVGDNSSFNQLLIPSGGVIAAGKNVLVGRDPVTSINNLLNVSGGTLRVLNPGSVLDVRGGTNRLDAGLVDVNRLVVTNARGQFELNSGTLRTRDSAVRNGRIFTVGNGASAATLQLIGGTHVFSNNLVVANNGSLIGNGVVEGTLTVSPGGRLTPGAPIGRIDVDGSVILQGTVNLQLDKSGGARTNDTVSASGAIFYSGTLNVTDIGTDFLSAGDRFVLFVATPYVGAFATLNLPLLEPGLSWRNNLAVDGSIEVIAASSPAFGSIVRSGTNVVLRGSNGVPSATYQVLTATNVAQPLSNWVSVVTNQFDGNGRFVFTNAIAPGERQRYFRIRTP